MGGFNWANVADDLLFLLSERVGVVTFIRFSAVCKSWHFIASATKCCKLIPWLMLIEKEGFELRDFYDHSTRELYQFSLPQAQCVKNLGFANGWLITAEEDCTFHLVNPLSGTKISLPPPTFITNHGEDDYEIDDYENDDYEDNNGTSLLEDRNFGPIKATCSPIGSDGNGIVALTYRGDSFSFAFCRLSDQGWTLFKNSLSCEVAFIDGAIYTVSLAGEISILDFKSSPMLIKIANLPDDEIIFSNACHTINCHIVECDGAILIGVKIYATSINRRGAGVLVDIRLFKLDKEGKKVVNLESMGDYALFFGTNDSFSLAIPSGGGFFKKNCIYFTNIDEYTDFNNDGRNEAQEEMMVYNMEDKSFLTHSLGMSKSSYSYPIWVLFDLLMY